jgi:NADPH:quinone reductase-like Zn-dependent oxidoreductase
VLAVTAARIVPDDPLAGFELGDRPQPDPPEGWEVVRVRAAALNHHDLWALRGVGLDPARLPIVLGCDAAGVSADGREVIVHAVVVADPAGDETLAPDFSVLSERYDGTHAEYVAVPRRNLVPKPPELSFGQAACLPTAYLTAYRMLFVRGGARAGDRVLVQGAGGGLATAAILLAHAAGIRVYATSRDEGKRRRALELGAHAALQPGGRLPERVDVVLETVGQATWAHSLRALEPGGTVVVSGATSGADPPADLRRVFYRQLKIVGSTMGTRAELVALTRLLVDTGTRPLIDEVIPLSRARDAYARLEGGDVVGKLVLDCTQ